MRLMKIFLPIWATTLVISAAAAPHKCSIDGQTVHQDVPCAMATDTVAEGLKHQQRIEDLHRKLDKLAARGVGMVQRAAPAPRPPKPDDGAPPQLGPRRSHLQRSLDDEAVNARLTAKTLKANAESADRLTEMLNKAAQGCDGKLPRYPTLGTSDESFRMCTLHARSGGVTQVVALEAEGVALRLYIFPTAKAQRVYSVGGVVTAIKP
jgi:hypothetical protein